MPKRDIDLSFLKPNSERIELPSRGILYNNSELKSGFLNIRPWLTNEEKLIDRFNKGNFYSILKRLISNSVTEKINVDELTLGDFFFLIYWIRSISYGHTYNADIVCPECGKSVSVVIDLSKYDVTYLEDCKEPMTLIMPRSGIEIKFRLPRVADLIEASESTLSGSKKFGVTISPDLYKTAKCVEEMVLPNEEKTLLTQKEDFDIMLGKIWPKIPAYDLVVIREVMSKYDHGYITNASTRCPECEATFEQAPLLSFEFFRPSSGESTTNS